MHDLNVRIRAVAKMRAGASPTALSRELNIPLGTITWWRHRDRVSLGEPIRPHVPTCPWCHGTGLDTNAYSYLLGLYLGDGHIVQPKQHRVPSLTIYCANDWPGLLDAAEAAMHAVFPNNKVCRAPKQGCQGVKTYSKHLACHFPQHGPGKKHERRILLTDWQQCIVDEHPWELLRGLIHSDGSRITNWTRRGDRRYEYPRYFFTNRSTDILDIFCDTLDAVGASWRVTRRAGCAYNISVARRDSVALMDAHIGPKY